jgi:hypothetical protein
MLLGTSSLASVTSSISTRFIKFAPNRSTKAKVNPSIHLLLNKREQSFNFSTLSSSQEKSKLGKQNSLWRHHHHKKELYTQTTNMSTSEMRRGMGGRLEESFAAAKEAGKAAFVSFITAGYPSAEGKLWPLLFDLGRKET